MDQVGTVTFHLDVKPSVHIYDGYYECNGYKAKSIKIENGKFIDDPVKNRLSDVMHIESSFDESLGQVFLTLNIGLINNLVYRGVFSIGSDVGVTGTSVHRFERSVFEIVEEPSDDWSCTRQ